MKKIAIYVMAAIGVLATACSDELDVVIPEPDNITFDEIAPQSRFTHVIPDNGFSCSGLNFNTVRSGSQLAGGFCISNRSYRSFVRDNNEAAIDSMRYSVWTVKPNNTGTYLVCHVNNDDAYFTLDKASVIDYILVGNTTWGYLAQYYGDTYGKEESPVANPNIPSAPKGVWHTYVPGGVKKMGAGDYCSVIAKGYLNGALTGEVVCDLCCTPGHNPENPTWSYFVNNWRRFDLAGLGKVDKVVFYMDSSDKDESGRMRTPAWFCVDGIQLAK